MTREESNSNKSLDTFNVELDKHSEELEDDFKNEKTINVFKKKFRHSTNEYNEHIKKLIPKENDENYNIKKKINANGIKKGKYHLRNNEFDEYNIIDERNENIKRKKKNLKGFPKQIGNYLFVSNMKKNNKYDKINKNQEQINKNKNTKLWTAKNIRKKDKSINKNKNNDIELSNYYNDNVYDIDNNNNNYSDINNSNNNNNNCYYNTTYSINNYNENNLNNDFVKIKNMNTSDYIMYKESMYNNLNNNKWNNEKNKKNKLTSNEDLDRHNDDMYILNNVNINDLYNIEINKNKDHKNYDIYLDKNNENSKMNIINNFLKKKKKKVKKNKNELAFSNCEENYNYTFCNNKKKKTMDKNKNLLFYENNNERKENYDKNLKYKVMSSEERILNIDSNDNNKKEKKKKKISMNILRNINKSEDIYKLKKKYRTIKKLALNEKKNKKINVFVFTTFLFLNIFINYDSGILPISLNKITDDFHLSTTLQGLLGSMPYIGLTIASFFLATILQKYEQKKIIIKSMILNIINIIVCFFCSNKFLFIFLRFIYGITHSVLVIYFPVWADEYAPSVNLTFWLGLIHISTIIGITIGYLCTGLLIYFNFSWVYSLLIQAFFIMFFSLFLLIIPKKFINISNISKNEKLNNISRYQIFNNNDTSASTCASDNNTIIIYVSKKDDYFNSISVVQNIDFTEDINHEQQILNNQKFEYLKEIFYKIKETYLFSSIVAILKCPLYMWLVCSLCNLFFVVIGIFFWSTKFFINYLNIGSLEAMLYFIGTSLTAPVIGILIGSKIVDKFIGGYKEYGNRLKTLYFCIFNSFLSFISALMICIFDNYKFTLIFTWIILLFGAMLLPPITGIILSTVKSEIRSFASAFSMFLYNIFGYALGTFLPGFIVDFFNVSEAFSIKVVYLWSFFGLINLCIATLFAKRKLRPI